MFWTGYEWKWQAIEPDASPTSIVATDLLGRRSGQLFTGQQPRAYRYGGGVPVPGVDHQGQTSLQGTSITIHKSQFKSNILCGITITASPSSIRRMSTLLKP